MLINFINSLLKCSKSNVLKIKNPEYIRVLCNPNPNPIQRCKREELPFSMFRGSKYTK